MNQTFLGLREVDWIAIQSICAIAGIIGLFFYTKYTRRMMKLNEESRRSEITPEFSVRAFSTNKLYRQNQDPFHIKPEDEIPNRLCAKLPVRNIGKGPAILFHAWHQPVSASFTLGLTTIFIPSKDTLPGEVRTLELLNNETTEVFFPIFNTESRWLFVIQCTDTAKGTHQLQLLRERGENAEIEWKMSHSLGDSPGERIVQSTRRLVEIINAVDKESEKLID